MGRGTCLSYLAVCTEKEVFKVSTYLPKTSAHYSRPCSQSVTKTPCPIFVACFRCSTSKAGVLHAKSEGCISSYPYATMHTYHVKHKQYLLASQFLEI